MKGPHQHLNTDPSNIFRGTGPMTSKERCSVCLYWDHRAETEVDAHTGYCTVHEMMKADSAHCPAFARRTPDSEQQYYNQLYNDGTDYGGDDVELGGF